MQKNSTYQDLLFYIEFMYYNPEAYFDFGLYNLSHIVTNVDHNIPLDTLERVTDFQELLDKYDINCLAGYDFDYRTQQSIYEVIMIAPQIIISSTTSPRFDLDEVKSIANLSITKKKLISFHKSVTNNKKKSKKLK